MPTTSCSDDGEWWCNTDSNISTRSLVYSVSWYSRQSFISLKCIFQVATMRLFRHNENVHLPFCGSKWQQDVSVYSVLIFLYILLNVFVSKITLHSWHIEYDCLHVRDAPTLLLLRAIECVFFIVCNIIPNKKKQKNATLKSDSRWMCVFSKGHDMDIIGAELGCLVG